MAEDGPGGRPPACNREPEVEVEGWSGFACVFNGLGAQVTLANRSPMIVKNFDVDIRDTLQEEMSKKGIDFLRVEPRITRNDRALTLDVEFVLTRLKPLLLHFFHERGDVLIRSSRASRLASDSCAQAYASTGKWTARCSG